MKEQRWLARVVHLVPCVIGVRVCGLWGCALIRIIMKKDYSVLLNQLDGNLASDVSIIMPSPPLALYVPPVFLNRNVHHQHLCA